MMNGKQKCNIIWYGLICCSVTKSCLDSLRPHGLQHARLLCPPLSSYSLSKFMSIEPVMLSNHLILLPPSPLPSIFISIRVFSSESALCVRWPKYWSFFFSISPSNEYSGLISWQVRSPCSPRDSQVSSPAPQFESISSETLSFPYGPILTFVHDYWKNHSILPAKKKKNHMLKF